MTKGNEIIPVHVMTAYIEGDCLAQLIIKLETNRKWLALSFDRFTRFETGKQLLDSLDKSFVKSPSRFRHINPLTPELNSFAQRCLTRFFTGILILEPCISLIYA
jgi:hypothetical protein